MMNHPLLRRPILVWAVVAAFALGAPVLATTQGGPLAVTVTTSPNPYAIEGTTSVTKSVGVLGYGTGTTDVALEGYATQPGSTGLEGFENATSGSGNGVFGYAAGGNGTGVYGVSNGLDGYGVFGDNTGEGTGILGLGTTGVEGLSSGGDGTVGESTSGTGLYGKSSSGYGAEGVSASSDAIHGTSDGTGASGVYGDAQNGYGVFAEGDSANDYPALYVQDDTPESSETTSFEVDAPAYTGFNTPGILILGSYGDLTLEGTVSGFDSRVRDSRGAEHQMYAPRDTEAISEDFGQARLVAGRASVALDPKFADLLGHRASYMVFITPDGDTPGLYVAQKAGDGFIVQEHGGTHSSLAFDYRIVGHPANEAPKARMPLFVMPNRHRRTGSRPAGNPAIRPAHAAMPKIPPMPFVYRPDKAATR